MRELRDRGADQNAHEKPPWYQALWFVLQIRPAAVRKMFHRRIFSAVQLLQRFEMDLRHSSAKDAMLVNVACIADFSEAVLEFEEDYQDKCVSVWIASSLLVQVYPVTPFISDNGLKKRLGAVSCRVLCQVIQLHGEMYHIFQNEKIGPLVSLLKQIAYPNIYQCISSMSDVKEPIMLAQQQLLHMIQVCKEQNAVGSKVCQEYPSYSSMCSLFTSLLSIECVYGSCEFALSTLQGVLQASFPRQIEVSFLKSWVERIKADAPHGSVDASLDEISAFLGLLWGSPVLSDLEATHKSLVLWMVASSYSSIGGRSSTASEAHEPTCSTPGIPECKGVVPQLVPAVVVLCKRSFEALKSVDIEVSLKYLIFDELVGILVGLSSTRSARGCLPKGRLKETLGKIVKFIESGSSSSKDPLDSTTRCSLVCFWTVQQLRTGGSKGHHVDPSLPEIMLAILSNLSPVIEMSMLELQLLKCMAADCNINMEEIKASIPWIVGYGQKYRPYVAALFAIEHANIASAPLDLSHNILRIVNYEKTMLNLGLQSLFIRIRSHVEEIATAHIRKEAFSLRDNHTDATAELLALVRKLLDHALTDEECSESSRSWIFHIVGIVFNECKSLAWDKGCIVQMVRLWCQKNLKDGSKLFASWFKTFSGALHADVMSSLMCMALSLGHVDLGSCEGEESPRSVLDSFKEPLMQKVFASMQLKDRSDIEAAQLILQAMSYEQVNLAHEFREFLSTNNASRNVASIKEQVQKISEGKGMHLKRRINLALAAGNVIALPVVSEVFNRMTNQIEDAPLKQESSKTNGTWESPPIATCLKGHKPWDQNAAKQCTQIHEDVHTDIIRNWKNVLESSSTASSFDKYIIFSMFARMIRLITGEIGVWAERIEGISELSMTFLQFINFCMEQNGQFSFCAENLRSRVARAVLIWLHQESTNRPCLSTEQDDNGSKKLVWGESFFARASEVSSNVEFALAMKLLDADHAHSRVWSRPLEQGSRQFSVVDTSAQNMVSMLWASHPAHAKLALRYDSDRGEVHLAKLILQNCHDPRVQDTAEYASIMLRHITDFPAESPYHALDHWRCTRPVDFVAFLPLSHPCIERHVMDSLHVSTRADVAFILPQAIQCLRYTESREMVEKLLTGAAKRDPTFLMCLIWNLHSEKTPPKEAFHPVIKRSGWKPPMDYGLWEIAEETLERIISVLPKDGLDEMEIESSYFEGFHDISSRLGTVRAEERVSALQDGLANLSSPDSKVYIPFDDDKKVTSIEVEDCITLPSAAKIPILVNFNTISESCRTKQKVGCIVKVGDDCRMDVMALQVVSVLKKAFRSSGLELFLYPYGVIPTGYECGLIEVVPNTKSRSGLGELSDRGLWQIFKQKFGKQGSREFETARMNFIKSCAGYAVASYILWAKDRHNGNLLLDDDGHLIHIDFGFILGISPGGNLGFENAGFKMSHEMCQLIDPLGNKKSKEYVYFKKLCIRGYLAARNVAQEIFDLVSLMQDSGLPCFDYKKPLAALKLRLGANLNTNEAAARFEGVVEDAYMKWTTGFYDVVQYLQQGIPK